MIKVAVLVTLYRAADAGGHVKVWERFARAAEPYGDRVDLTVYFMGPREETFPRADHVRFRHLPPRFGTDRIPFLGQGAGHTDLASRHDQLAKELVAYDLVVSTDIFSFGRTAERVCQEHGIPLIHSMHTDVVYFTRVYSVDILKSALGRRFGTMAAEKFDLGNRFAKGVEKRLAAHLQIANQVMVSRSEDQDTVRSIVPDQKVTVLRRGVERALFTPDKRDRAALQERFGIPENRPVILFAGRVDASKGAMTAVQAVRHLLDQGRDVHMILAGKGDDMDLAKDCLGGRLTAPGMVPQEDLAVLYASSDIFVFPSESETFGNVVLEARSSGLPVVVSGNPGGCSRFVAPDRTDGMVVTARDPQGWAHAIADLLEMDYPEMGRLARSRLEGERCGWRDVFDEDLLTVWEACVADYRRDPVGGSHP